MSIFDKLEEQKDELRGLSCDLKKIIAKLMKIDRDTNFKDIKRDLDYIIKELKILDDLMYGN